jgi:hypothetical protein
LACHRPQHSVTTDYVVWIILTLCEVPWVLIGIAIAIASHGGHGHPNDDDDMPDMDGIAFAISMVWITLATAFLTVTAILAHSFRSRNEGGQRMALLPATN